MGEYECIDCNEMFWAEEPPYPKDQCEACWLEENEQRVWKQAMKGES